MFSYDLKRQFSLVLLPLDLCTILVCRLDRRLPSLGMNKQDIKVNDLQFDVNVRARTLNGAAFNPYSNFWFHIKWWATTTAGCPVSV